MQTSDRVLAHRYALAFHQACAAAKIDDKARLELVQAFKALKPRLQAFSHPLLSPPERKKLLKELVGSGLSPATQRFLELMIEKKRFSLLPLVLQNFEKIHEEAKGIVKAQVRTAVPLEAAQLESLKRTLEKASGKSVQLDVKEAPELLGGLVVKMGDWVLDRSFANALNRMKESFAA